MSGYWNEKAETMSRDELAAHQLAKLKETVRLAYENNSFYKARLDAAGVKPGDIEMLEDFRHLPFRRQERFS